jgi:hypothetical protein
MTAFVTGRYYGRRVWSRLALTDGCAIARWNGLAFLFPQRGRPNEAELPAAK